MPGLTLHPNVQAMLDYWHAIQPHGVLPGRQHLEPLNIPQFLQNIRLVEVYGRPFRFRVRLMGTGIVEHFGQDHTGKWLDEVFPGFNTSETCRDYRSVVVDKVPNWRRGKSRLLDPKCDHTIERIILPLAEDGELVDMLLIYSEIVDQA